MSVRIDNTLVDQVVNRQFQPTPETGSLAAVAQTVSTITAGFRHVVFALSGTFASCDHTFEVSYDGGTTWFAVAVTNLATGATVATTGAISAQALYRLDTAGAPQARVRMTARTSGTVNVTIQRMT
ncbi:hypothetical protein UFOVP347_41 [uncultured Caudovirales phage]|uniref:Uncharacterized protein n=1 Tax=uncultured Caudovirales phage TaxID=2100421 RepID=A0A6J5M243_9CAUD|nr:hypothetical protein UFOVP347_41 [uncultured Caudovirales phage]